MAFKLNLVVCVWKTVSLGHLNLNLNRGRQLGYLLLDNGGGGVKQLISSSSSYSPSSWFLCSRGIAINSCSCNSCFTTCASGLEDVIKPRNHPPLWSMAPCLLIPSPKEDDDHKDEVIAAIAKEVGKGTGEEEEFLFPEYCFYSLAERKVVSLNNVRSKSNIVIPDRAICVGSSHGWLAYLDPHERALFLTNPLVSPVPPTIRLPRLPRFLNPKSCSDFKKLVMSCAPSSDNNNDCTVMVSISRNCHNLVFCKVGDSSWTELEADHEVIVYSNKDQLFYSRNFYDESKFAAWDLRNSCSPHRIDIDSPFAYGMPDYPESEKKQRERYLYGNWQHYLVVESHSGNVLLVSKYCDFRSPLRTIRIDVYKLNAPKRGWDYVTDLGDGVVFVGLNQAFHLSALDFAPGVLIPNSIYFTPDNDKLDYEMGIYNMRDFTVTSFFPSHLHPFNKIHQPPPIWFTPNPWNN